MSVFIRLAIGLHALLTRWYPSDFRDEFGAEMQVVFAELVGETAQNHGRR